MNKIRVYELAKQMGISSKDLVQKLKTSGVEVKNHMSSIDSEEVNKIKSKFDISKKADSGQKKIKKNSEAQKPFVSENNKTKANKPDKNDSRTDNQIQKSRSDECNKSNKKNNNNNSYERKSGDGQKINKKNSNNRAYFKNNKVRNDVAYKNLSQVNKDSNSDHNPDRNYLKNKMHKTNNQINNKPDQIKINKNNNHDHEQNSDSNKTQRELYSRQNKNKNKQNQNKNQVKNYTVDSTKINDINRDNNNNDFKNNDVNNKNNSNGNKNKYKNRWKQNNLKPNDLNSNQTNINQINSQKERPNYVNNNRKKMFNKGYDQNKNYNRQAQVNNINNNENENKIYDARRYQKKENLNDYNKNTGSNENKNYHKDNYDANNNADLNKNLSVENKPRYKESYKFKSGDSQNNNNNNKQTGFRRTPNKIDIDKDISQLQNNNSDAQNQNRQNENRKSKSKDKPKKNKYDPANKNIRSKSQLIDDLDKLKKPLKNKKPKSKSDKNKISEPEKIDISVIKISKSIVLKELAEKIDKPVSELIKILMLDGMMVNQNQIINFDLASKITERFNIISELVEEIDLFETELFNKISSESQESELSERPPIVVVMGHVDHGKTSLLDAIRHTNIINTEAGGITQHIGAYTVSISGKQITFLDTPGHEAFTAMRMRGAQATDIAILVVAADDGIMPQTIEAINHAKAAGVEIVVAINKIDKPGANVDRVKQELVEYGLVSEDWGGKTVCVPVSAKNNIGIDNLLEMIILVAEMHELKADKNKKASGIIIEAKLDKGRGPIATVLVQDGTLEIGNPIVAGDCYGKVRAMIDDKGNRVKKALPSTPVEIFGLSAVPNAGDSFYVTNSEKQARQLAESVINKNKVSLLKNNIANNKVSLDDLFDKIKTGDVKDLAVIIKADVQGSVEAIKNSLERLSNNEVKIKVIHGGVGAITESDIMLASASNAIVIGFNVRPDQMAKSVAESEKVDIRLYKIIYDAIEDIKAAMKGLLDPVYQEKIIGHAEVRQLFKVSSLGTIAGSYVTDGKITRNSKIRVIRDGVNIYEGEIATLKRFKDDAKEVSEGYECGILVNKFNDIKENDVLESYIMEEIAQ